MWGARWVQAAAPWWVHMHRGWKREQEPAAPLQHPPQPSPAPTRHLRADGHHIAGAEALAGCSVRLEHARGSYRQAWVAASRAASEGQGQSRQGGQRAAAPGSLHAPPAPPGATPLTLVLRLAVHVEGLQAGLRRQATAAGRGGAGGRGGRGRQAARQRRAAAGRRRRQHRLGRLLLLGRMGARQGGRLGRDRPVGRPRGARHSLCCVGPSCAWLLLAPDTIERPGRGAG